MSITHQDLEKFEKDCEQDLNLIKTHLNAFNIFNVLGIQFREIRHSNFLGWLMDPMESHDLKSTILKELLKHLATLNLIGSSDLNYFFNPELEGTKVFRESINNIDILIVNEKLGLVITIENKIHSDFSKHQLSKYYDYIEKHYKALKTRIYLTLTPFDSNRHNDFKAGEYYTNITYKSIIGLLVANEEKIDKTKPSIKESIQQYISMVEKDLTRTSKEFALAKEIYRKYKKEIEFIINNQEDFTIYKSMIVDYLKNGIEGYVFSHESPNRNVLFLLPNDAKVLKLFHYPKAESRGGNYIFSYVLHIEKNRVWMKLGFGNIVDSEQKDRILEERDNLHSKMKEFHTIYQNNIPNLEIFSDDSKSDYIRICSISLFNDSDLISAGKTFMDMFKYKFNEVDRTILQPFTEECVGLAISE